jgi:uncharacterized protein YggU (UPF0235/DUF167 family)
VITDVPDGAVIDIRVIPRAGRSEIAGTRAGSLLIRLAAAPVDGAANLELIALLARALELPKRNFLSAAKRAGPSESKFSARQPPRCKAK